MDVTDQQHSGRATPQESLAEQDWAGVAKQGVHSMTPADKGWILAVVVIVLVLQSGDVLRDWMSTDRAKKSSELFGIQLTNMETNRSDEIRRCQEVLKEMSQAVARQHEYQGRAQHEQTLIKKKPDA